MNKEHVENLNAIAKLESAGFSGTDASLAISLFEYGMAWKDYGEETLFVYANPNHKGSFDRCTFKSNTDLQKEFDWVSWTEFTQFIGCEFGEWNQLPLGQKIWDLVNYYGSEEIFGTSSWEGFKITE